jgi:ABC-type dipeptide/oligopeptide/nickel transport system permease subunit
VSTPADLAGASTPVTRPWALLGAVRRNPELAAGSAIAALLLLLVAAPGLVASTPPNAIDIAAKLQPPSSAHWFGTDDLGRDIFARVVYGTRVTLGIVAGSLLASAIVGGVLGVLAGFAGKLVDMVGGRLIDVVLSFPPIVLGVVITGILGQGVPNLVLALALVYVPVFFRIARSGALTETGKTYVEAARSLGAGPNRILLRHVLPNVLPLIFLQYTILFPLALQIEAALGFLGLGVPPPVPDWGASLEQAKNFVLAAPWMSIYPGLAVLIAALGVVLLGRGLQRLIDVR